MKISLILLFTMSLFVCNAQQSEEKTEIKLTIEHFFEAFHKQDTIAMKTFVNEAVILQTVKAKQDTTRVVTEPFSQFLTQLSNIPPTFKFTEKLLNYTIQIDGKMANAWVDYEFWVNDKFSHCGVNSFQLVKVNGNWKIIYLIDTRRRDCKSSN